MCSKLKIWIQYLTPQHFLSRLIGKLMDSKIKCLKNKLIHWAIKSFSIDLSEAEREDPKDYFNFNDFFTRKLKPNLRPIDSNPKTIISPADGIISQFGKIDHNQLIQAKGKYFTIDALLAHSKYSENFIDGHFATVYLSPKDYHRVHLPFSGQLIHTQLIPGKLFSVNLLTSNHVNNLFARNERLILIFKTEFGLMGVILVGAMLVASIQTPWHGIITPNKSNQNLNNLNPKNILNKGSEIGAFRFGSTAIILLPKNTGQFNSKLQLSQSIQMGQDLFNLNQIK